MISLEKLKILTAFQKLPKIVGDIGQIWLLPNALKNCPKSNKSPNMVTLVYNDESLEIPSTCHQTSFESVETILGHSVSHNYLQRSSSSVTSKPIIFL